MTQPKRNFLEKWIHIIKEWSESLARKKTEQSPKPTILRQRAGKGCILLQMERNTPGSVSTWRFNCELLKEQSLLLTLDNITDLERHLLRAERQKNPANTRRETVYSPTRASSHRIGISLVNSLKRTEFIGVWDANFIDHWATTHAEDYKAERLLLYTALRVLSSYEVMPEFFENEIRSKEWWEQRILYLSKGEFLDNHKINLLFRSEIKTIAESQTKTPLRASGRSV
jgi:hypothetical protein